MTTQGEVMQGWKGYGCRIAVIMYLDEIKRQRKHEKLWAQLFINRHKNRPNKIYKYR